MARTKVLQHQHQYVYFLFKEISAEDPIAFRTALFQVMACNSGFLNAFAGGIPDSVTSQELGYRFLTF